MSESIFYLLCNVWDRVCSLRPFHNLDVIQVLMLVNMGTSIKTKFKCITFCSEILVQILGAALVCTVQFQCFETATGQLV